MVYRLFLPLIGNILLAWANPSQGSFRFQALVKHSYNIDESSSYTQRDVVQTPEGEVSVEAVSAFPGKLFLVVRTPTSERVDLIDNGEALTLHESAEPSVRRLTAGGEWVKTEERLNDGTLRTTWTKSDAQLQANAEALRNFMEEFSEPIGEVVEAGKQLVHSLVGAVKAINEKMDLETAEKMMKGLYGVESERKLADQEAPPISAFELDMFQIPSEDMRQFFTKDGNFDWMAHGNLRANGDEFKGIEYFTIPEGSAAEKFFKAHNGRSTKEFKGIEYFTIPEGSAAEKFFKAKIPRSTKEFKGIEYFTIPEGSAAEKFFKAKNVNTN